MRYLPVTVFTVLSGRCSTRWSSARARLAVRQGRQPRRAAMNTLKQLEDGDPTKLNSHHRLVRTAAVASRPLRAGHHASRALLLTHVLGLRQVRRGSSSFSDSEPKFADVTCAPRQPERRGDQRPGARSRERSSGGHGHRERQLQHAAAPAAVAQRRSIASARCSRAHDENERESNGTEILKRSASAPQTSPE